MKSIEIWMVWNEDGDMTADMDRDVAIERLTDDYGGQMRREMKVTVNVTLPEPVEVEITLPETADIPTVSVSE